MTYGIVTAVGGTDSYGIHNTASSPVLTNIKVTASQGTSNYGLWNDSSSTTIQNSIINGSGGGTNDGIHNIASSGSYTVKIDNSQVTGFTSTIYQDSHYTTQVGASQVIGAGVFGGTYTCVASYNGNYIALNSTCH